MKSNSPITYAPRSDATPEGELSALSAVYKFILDSHAKKEATRPGSPEDAERRSDEIGATSKYTD
jgi:hypothetical protein